MDFTVLLYRFLIDAKIYEANLASGKNKEELINFFKQNYNYDGVYQSSQ